jgi:glycolate oxidase iron-sulfur subunit
MQTNLSDDYRDTPQGREADSILRACVHCGFCTATCPTYQLLGDELDSPRGRIYLIKQVLEGANVTASTQKHLDRCLTCRSCETTCPSGVRYGRLVDIGRELVEKKVSRGILENLRRILLRKIIPYPKRMLPFLRTGQLLKPILPEVLKRNVPDAQKRDRWPTQTHARKMLALAGCVQSIATPQTNAATAQLLGKIGIQLVEAANSGCCGAVSHHLSAHEEGLDFMRRNIDAWWPYIEQGAEAIVITASGCGAVVKDYGELLRHDTEYADKAKRVSELAKDIAEVLQNEHLPPVKQQLKKVKVAFHSPCTLQHGQQVNGIVESILNKTGFQLTQVADAHLCCGSAGTYSILQPELSQRLLKNKLTALMQGEPDVIVTANIGCQLHIASATGKPVQHWVELLHESLEG